MLSNTVPATKARQPINIIPTGNICETSMA